MEIYEVVNLFSLVSSWTSEPLKNGQNLEVLGRSNGKIPSSERLVFVFKNIFIGSSASSAKE